jgi:hypothetical protein
MYNKCVRREPRPGASEMNSKGSEALRDWSEMKEKSSGSNPKTD